MITLPFITLPFITLPFIAVLLATAVVGGCTRGVTPPTTPTAPRIASVDSTVGPATSVGTSGVGEAGSATDGAGGSSGRPSRGTDPGADPGAAAATAAVQDLLTQRAGALSRRDRPAWAATVDPGAPEAAGELAAYDTLAALGVRELLVGPVTGARRAVLQGSTPGVTTPATEPEAGSWSATVSVGYHLPGFDRGLRTAVRTVTVRERAGAWQIRRWVGPSDQWEPWDLPGVSWARTEAVLAVGNVPVVDLADRAAEAQQALSSVTEVVGQATPAVLLVPRTAADAARLLGRNSPAGQGQLAASTVGPRAAGAPALADRVVLSPEGWARLLPAGRRVVLAHELTHVAMRATTVRDVPLWLSEGFAEWVAYRDSGLAVGTIAAALLRDVRDLGPPLGLPEDRAFDPAGAQAVRAYQGSWLAVSRIAREFGPDRVLRCYREIAGVAPGGPPGISPVVPPAPTGAPWAPSGASGPGASTDAEPAGALARRTDAAFLAVLGTSRTQFETQWRDELVRLARG